MAEKRTTSLRVDPEIWKKVRVYCAENDLDISEYIENLIKKDLKL